MRSSVEVKRFFSYHGTKKGMSFSDGTIDIQDTIAQVELVYNALPIYNSTKIRIVSMVRCIFIAVVGFHYM